MKRFIIFLIILILTLNSTFAIVTDITFHSKFDKPENKINNLNFNGFPAHSFSQHNQKFKFIKDNREKEIDYIDTKRNYNNQRKGNFNTKSEVPEDLYKFEKNYRDNEYKKYKREYYSSNNNKINYFKQQGLKFKSTENYLRNNY